MGSDDRLEGVDPPVLLGDLPEAEREGADRGYEGIRDGRLGAYHTYDEVVERIAEVAREHPGIVSIETIGTTWQGRAIPAVRITNPSAGGEKPAVLYTGQTHGNEVIGAEVMLGLIDRLTDGYGSDARVTSLVDSRDIWIVPCLNPDGSMMVAREVAETGDSAWRKNGRDNDGDGALGPYDGVDLNRNYPIGWGAGDASSDPSADVYIGPEPFSEPEARAIRDLAARVPFAASAHMHSYSNLILYPIGYTTERCRDDELVRAIAEGMRDRQPHERYLVEKTSDFYVCGGAEDDYLYETHGTLAFTYEVGKGEYGPGAFRSYNPPEADIPYHVENCIEPLLYLADIADDPRRALEERGAGEAERAPGYAV